MFSADNCKIFLTIFQTKGISLTVLSTRMTKCIHKSICNCFCNLIHKNAFEKHWHSYQHSTYSQTHYLLLFILISFCLWGSLFWYRDQRESCQWKESKTHETAERMEYGELCRYLVWWREGAGWRGETAKAKTLGRCSIVCSSNLRELWCLTPTTTAHSRDEGWLVGNTTILVTTNKL